MKIKEIEELKPLIVGCSGDFEFKGVACDSRQVRPGDLFVAVPGSKEDGVRYIDTALKRGAAGVVGEQIPPFLKQNYVKVSDARMALALLSGAITGWPAKKLDVFSITGTNGKTTTAWLLGEMLKAGGRQAGVFTTVCVAYAGREIPAVRTTPPAPELHRLFADMRRSGCNTVVMESSSHALEQRRVAGIPFAGGVFTNLSLDHLDYHKTMDAYFAAKLLMFQQMAELNPGAPAICCIDSPYGLEMAQKISKLPLKLITTGFSEQAQLRATGMIGSVEGSEFVIEGCGSDAVRVRSALAGRYNVENILCAAALAHAVGVAWADIVAVAERVRPRWGRLERVPLPNSPVAAFVDYAHTDDALKNVLSTLAEITRGRLIVVFGCGGDRDRSKRPLMGKICAELADELVITSDNPRGEEPEKIIEEILAGIESREHLSVCVDRREAIRKALRMAGPDDVILVAGKGHECFQESLGRSLPFDDRKVLIDECEEK